ncbi:hypothetical protein LXT12_18075 [Pelomonas sp. P7]|uniref:Uncharacterized protein n=1 Tax=Pelomonas caseinilytica TaxID=2906763 RepID=A0ABS8XJG8_9BURK|nr:hypothetical protein [Pelomonas sp. P7]MCE4539163.1 hypothetical protein [Pelomonas sp. P7]
MRNSLIVLSAAALLPAPVLAQDSLQGCRALADTARRLACYDTLADAARPAVALLPASAPSPEAAFGLPESRRPDSIDAVRSAVGPHFAGWGPNSRIRLDNGQVWQVVDGSSVVVSEGARAVTVKRGALGSFLLDIEGLKTSPRVRRVE